MAATTKPAHPSAPRIRSCRRATRGSAPLSTPQRRADIIKRPHDAHLPAAADDQDGPKRQRTSWTHRVRATLATRKEHRDRTTFYEARSVASFAVNLTPTGPRRSG